MLRVPVCCFQWTGEVTIKENLFENNVATSEYGWAYGGGLGIYG